MDAETLLNAVERYLNGEMSEEESKVFDELRIHNPEVDQVVVEHSILLSRFENLRDRKELKQTLAHVESKLEQEGAVMMRKGKTKARVIHLWRRYRRTIAVAAAIAGIVSIVTASTVSLYSENKKVSAITPLVDNKIHQMENKISIMENKLKDATDRPIKPVFEANFRATGFLIDYNGYILTNAHVVNKARHLIVENIAGKQYAATPIYVNDTTDVAILKITDTSFAKNSKLPYTFSREAADLAEPIFTLGYPREEIVYGEGYLSALSGYFGDTTAYQISISANPGNSGGPVLNKFGQVIGVISSKETNADGVVFAIKSDNIYQAIHTVDKDTTNDVTIQLPIHNALKGLSRVQQIKKLENYVFKVKGN